MISGSKSVSQYLKSVPKERKAALVKLREFCANYLKGFEETMEYGMPAYKRDGVVQVAFGSQKNYISLYILKKDVLDNYRQDLKDSNVGKGCIRYSKPEKINFSVVKKLLEGTSQSTAKICPR